MTEYIEREVAIKKAVKVLKGITESDFTDALLGIVVELDDIPSADVTEVKHGAWIDKGQEDDAYEYTYECSECHNWFFMVDKEYNYCPNCGAKMDKE